MDDQLSEWLGYLPEPRLWPEELARILGGGSYVHLRHTGDWLILLSAEEGDTAEVQGGGRVQARLAVNRTTGELRRPDPGTSIDEWEAVS